MPNWKRSCQPPRPRILAWSPRRPTPRSVHEQEEAIYKQEATTERKYLDAVQKSKAAQAALERSGRRSARSSRRWRRGSGQNTRLVAEVEAQLAEARLNLEWTRVYAPCDGLITDLQLREGAYTHTGRAAMTLIDTSRWLVVANFRENALIRLREGQPAGVAFRSLPGRLFAARVVSVGWGVSQGQGVPSGQLPDVKVPTSWVPPAQRFQVRLALDDPESVPMRVGMTGSVAVYTEPEGMLNDITHVLAPGNRLAVLPLKWLQGVPPMTPALDTRDTTSQALLTAVATVVCLAVAEVLGLGHANLAVWTTFMVMAQYPFTRFQKGLERVVGRGLGILTGLILTTWFNDTSLLTLALIAVLLTCFFYFYFAGRLAYTFLQAGLYVVASSRSATPTPGFGRRRQRGSCSPPSCSASWSRPWLRGWPAPSTISASASGDAPLWPGARRLAEPEPDAGRHGIADPARGPRARPAAREGCHLGNAPHGDAARAGNDSEGRTAFAGASWPSVWALGTFLVVGLLPYFPLLAGLLFLGQFMAAYLTVRPESIAYAGVQMGLVLPMLVVAPPAEFGSLTPAFQRLEGVLLGLAASVVVASLWPRFPLADRTVPVPPPNLPGEMDV